MVDSILRHPVMVSLLDFCTGWQKGKVLQLPPQSSSSFNTRPNPWKDFQWPWQRLDQNIHPCCLLNYKLSTARVSQSPCRRTQIAQGATRHVGGGTVVPWKWPPMIPNNFVLKGLFIQITVSIADIVRIITLFLSSFSSQEHDYPLTRQVSF